MFYTVTFNPALDYVMTFDALQPGGTNRASGEELMPGGKGINVSLILRRLGVASTALGFTAGRTGSMLRAWLDGQGIQTAFVDLPAGETRVNVKVKSAGQETELNGRGPDIPPQALDALLARLASLAEGDTLILSGSIPPTVPRDIYQRLLAALPQGVRAVVDTEGEPLLKSLPYRPFLIKPNLKELEDLCGLSISLADPDAVARCAGTLQEKGAQNVLVSLGGHGALLLTREGEVFTQAAAPGKAVNSVGSGDSMVAGFLVGYDRGGYQEGLRLGSAAGSATALSPRLATEEEIRLTYDALA